MSTTPALTVDGARLWAGCTVTVDRTGNMFARRPLERANR